MLDTLILILTLLLKAASLWFLAVAFFALRKPKRYAVCAPRTRFACLVAARNEEAVIGALVESLKKQDYPDALYDIFVIPNNCTDDTESEALCAGAKIFRCFEPVRCKGDALHEAFETLLRKDYDAFCVFDADNVADEQFLARMNDAFCAGAQVCKGAMRAKNPYDSWLSGCYGLYFTLFDTFFSRARMSCGLSSKLVGTGFAVHRAVLERFGGWNTSTIAEDAEFAAQCAARETDPAALDEAAFSSYLYTKGVPDPDLLIRTCGEERLSNFLMWQLSYSELYFTDASWPDFTKEELEKAVDVYNHRERRFGGLIK